MWPATIESTLQRWFEENPAAYSWIEASASLTTAEFLASRHDLVLQPECVQDELYPILSSPTGPTSHLSAMGSVRPTTTVHTYIQPAPIKLQPRIVDIQRHPLLDIKETTPPPGWGISATKGVARQIAAYCLGRPSLEWSALALIDTYWRTNTAKYVVRELFFCDDGRDSGGHSRISAAWEMKLKDKLLIANREADIPKLIGHVHSHNSMGAFWSPQDVLMCGQRLDDMSASGNQSAGLAVSIVVDNNLNSRGRMDWFNRENGKLLYNTFDPVPTTLAPPKLVAVQDVLKSRNSGYSTPQPYQYGYTMP